MHSPPAEVICSRIHSVIQWASTGSWVLNQSIRSIHHLRISVGDEHWWICSHRLAFHLKNGACSCGLHILRSEHCTVCVGETDGKRRESSMCSFQSVCLYQSLFYLVRTRKGMIKTMLTYCSYSSGSKSLITPYHYVSLTCWQRLHDFLPDPVSISLKWETFGRLD